VSSSPSEQYFGHSSHHEVPKGPLPVAPRILVLVLGSDRLPWSRIQDFGQTPTWATHFRSRGIAVVTYTGSTPTNYVRRSADQFERLKGVRLLHRHTAPVRTIQKMFGLWPRRITSYEIEVIANSLVRTTIPDSIALMGARLAAALQALDAVSYDYVVRTNSSSYLSLPGVIAAIQRMKDFNEHYAGSINRVREEVWVSGSGAILDQAAVTSLLRGYDSWPHELTEDRAIGRVLRDVNIRPMELQRINLVENDQVLGLRARSVRDFQARGGFQYRCKTPNPADAVLLMQSLHTRLLKLGCLDVDGRSRFGPAHPGE